MEPNKEIDMADHGKHKRTKKDASKNLDYLVIGSISQKAWAYSTYGRKIETVLNHRRHGAETQIIHEHDFVAAVEKSAESG